MEALKNCKECMYASTCNSWYGGTSCKVKDEIYRTIIEKNTK